jgi:hypothetical protein
MAKAAMTEMQQRIEAVRRDAFAAGYAAAMQAVRDLASRSAPKDGTSTAAPSRRGRGRARQAAPAAQPTRSRRSRRTGAALKVRRSAAHRSQRGTNALIIEEILKAMAPSAVRPAEIRKALQDNGVTISFASIHHALRQLETRNAAEPVGDSGTWRHRDDTA